MEKPMADPIRVVVWSKGGVDASPKLLSSLDIPVTLPRYAFQ
jgi:hypothetical protein